MARLDIPARLRRGHFRDRPEDALRSALILLDRIRDIVGVGSLAGVRFLDIGCGDKFSDALINGGVEIGEYHGVDVNAGIIAFLTQAVDDPRFSYRHIDVHNAMYNPAGAPLSAQTDIGAEGRAFDAIGLFSVFTHLAPGDYRAMLGLARRYVAPAGKLIFTGFVRDQAEAFVDYFPERPLLRAIYSEPAVSALAAETGWRIENISAPVRGKHGGKKRTIICSPA